MKALEKFNNDIKKSIIACKCNNELKSLNEEISENDLVEPIDFSTKQGRRIYRRGILYIMGMAFYKVCPEALLTVNCHLSNSIYCTIDNMEVTEELVKQVKSVMQKIIDNDLEIRKVKMILF